MLDEPFAGLDPMAVLTLAEVLGRNCAWRGRRLLRAISSSSWSTSAKRSIIDHGRIVATGDVDLLRRSSHTRRIELQLDGAPTAWLPRLPASSSSSAASTACGCSPNVTSTRNRSSKRRSASLGWSLSATGHRRWRSCSWSWSNHERDERNHARRAARDPRALARSGIPLVDADHADHPRGVERAADDARDGPTYRVAVAVPAPPDSRSHCSVPPNHSRPTSTCRSSAPPLPVATRSPRRTWTRSCSSTRTGSSSVRASTRSSRQPQTLRCEALRRHLPPAPELTTATLEPTASETAEDAETLVAMLGARCCSSRRPVGARRRGRGEEQPRRRVGSVGRAATPPSRRQGDRDRPARAHTARTRRRARRHPAGGRGLRRALIARRQRRARRALVRARVRAVRGRLCSSRCARRPTAGRELGGAAGHVHAARRLLRRLRDAHCRRGGDSRSHPHRVSGHCATCSPGAEPLVGVPLWEHALALALVLVSIYALIGFAGRVYGQGLLHAGSRLRIRTAWRLTQP